VADLLELVRNTPRAPQPITKEIITALAREYAAKQFGETGLTYAQAAAKALWEGAIVAAQSGNAALMNTLLDRLEGKLPQTTAHTGPDGGIPEVIHTIRPSVSRETWLEERGLLPRSA